LETNVYESDLEKKDFNELVESLQTVLGQSADKFTTIRGMDLINEIVTTVESDYVHHEDVANYINDNPPVLS
jgi:predicted sugar kinase